MREGKQLAILRQIHTLELEKKNKETFHRQRITNTNPQYPERQRAGEKKKKKEATHLLDIGVKALVINVHRRDNVGQGSVARAQTGDVERLGARRTGPVRIIAGYLVRGRDAQGDIRLCETAIDDLRGNRVPVRALVRFDEALDFCAAWK